MNPSTVHAAAAAHSAAAFAAPNEALAGWVWHDTDEQNTIAAPAAWLELVAGSRTTTKRLNRTSFRVVVVVEQLETGPTSAQWLDAVDRLTVQWTSPPTGLALINWRYQLTDIEVGGVPHNGLTFDIELEHPAPC